ncbi:hypothetical protein B1H10_03470 [candidate division KSB1 bacterium 4484_188]|nr:MAG: hypothetical protein B1H10_03470 [candidate division KSB1 bacterium 4484_188]
MGMNLLFLKLPPVSISRAKPTRQTIPLHQNKQKEAEAEEELRLPLDLEAVDIPTFLRKQID